MGRPKGSPNKKPISFERIKAVLARTGHDPLLTQVRFAMGDDKGLKLPPGTITPAMRKSANEFILERMYPTLKAVEVSSEDGAPLQINVINFSTLEPGQVLAEGGTVIDGRSTKEIEQRAALPKAQPPKPPVDVPKADPLQALRREGERPIGDNIEDGVTPFGTVIPAKRA